VSFVALQENLRREVRKRIEAGDLTGMELARRTGFTQAHISNFLNRKRGLKLGALDRMLKAIGLGFYDLLNPHDLARFAEVPAGSDTEYAEVPLVGAATAVASEVVVNDEVLELYKIKRAILDRLRPDIATPARKAWTRFVLIRLDPREAAGLSPRIAPGAVLLLDRHSQALRPYHRNERSFYAVRKPDGLTVRYVELAANCLVLRPFDRETPVEILPLAEGQNYADLLAGRVAYVSSEI
jgi:hypothetical protein